MVLSHFNVVAYNNCEIKIKTYSNYKVQNINMSSFGRGGPQAPKSDFESTALMRRGVGPNGPLSQEPVEIFFSVTLSFTKCSSVPLGCAQT